MIPAFVQCLITGNELTAGIVLIYGAIKIRQRIFVFSSDQFQVTNSRFWMEAPSQSSTFLLASFHFLLQRFNKSKTKPKILLFHSNSAVNRRRFSTLEQQPRDTFNHLIICVEHSSSPQKVRKKKGADPAPSTDRNAQQGAKFVRDSSVAYVSIHPWAF